MSAIIVLSLGEGEESDEWSIGWTTPIANHSFVNGSYNFSVTVNQSVDNCTLYYAGDSGTPVMIATDHHAEPQTVFSVSNSTAVAGIPDGNYTFNMTCGNSTDSSGTQISNHSQIILNITVDNTPATIASFNITDGTSTLTNSSNHFNGSYFLRNSTGLNITILVNDTKANMSAYNVTVFYNTSNEIATISGDNGTKLVLSTTGDTPPYSFENASLNAPTDGANVSVYIYINDSARWETNNSGVNLHGTFNFTVDGSAPTPSVGLSATSATTAGSITITCSSTDIADPNPTEAIIVKNSAGTAIASFVGNSYVFSTTDTGDYTATCRGVDILENVGTVTSATMTITNVANDGGTPSGGGGGPSSTTIVNKIKAGGSETVNIGDKNIGVTQIKITVKEEASNIKVTVTKHESKPEEATSEFNGKTYRYLTFGKENIEDSNIEKVEIKFKVEKSWLTENSHTKEKIALFRFKEGKWNKLTTTILDEDDENIYYSSTSPGFSAFAMGVENEAGENKTGDEILDEETGEEESTMNLTWLWIVIAIIVIAIVYFAVEKRKK